MECAHMELRLVRIVGSVMCVMTHACMYIGTHACTHTHTHIILLQAAPYSALRSSSNWLLQVYDPAPACMLLIHL